MGATGAAISRQGASPPAPNVLSSMHHKPGVDGRSGRGLRPRLGLMRAPGLARRTQLEVAMPGIITLQRVLRTSPEKIYRAFLEPDAFAKWLPPDGFVCTV